MINFLEEYGSSLLTIVLVLLDVVLFPFLKAKLTKANKDNSFAKIVEKLPDYISEAEDLFSNGRSKLAYVLQKCYIDCLTKHLDFSENTQAILTDMIENILETPQKK